jgi:pimeloyl-ACP methyl ester carboxylesterase
MLPLGDPDRTELVGLNRTTLRLWCWGDPVAPPVLLLHGAYDHGRMFDELAPMVAELGYHAIAVDLRGHGDSGPLDTGFAWALLHLDLALLIRHLGAPVGFVAHSFGGGQAGGVAGAFPELVRWIVNIDGLGPPEVAMQPPDDIPAAIRQAFDAVDRATLQPPRPWVSLEEMAARRGRNNPRLSERWTRHLARHGARATEDGGWVWKADRMFGVGIPSEFGVGMLEAEIRAVRCPVLVLTGTEPDTWRELTDEQVVERVGWFPDGRHEVVPGTGHYVHLEDPVSVMAHIERFVAEVGP